MNTRNQVLRIKKLVLNPLFNNRRSLDHDIALIEVEIKENNILDNVNPICLSNKEFYQSAKCVTAGWGATKGK